MLKTVCIWDEDNAICFANRSTLDFLGIERCHICSRSVAGVNYVLRSEPARIHAHFLSLALTLVGYMSARCGSRNRLAPVYRHPAVTSGPEL